MSSDSDSGLTAGGIAGLVLFILVILFIAFAIYFGLFWNKKRQNPQTVYEVKEHDVFIPITEFEDDLPDAETNGFSFSQDNPNYGYEPEKTLYE